MLTKISHHKAYCTECERLSKKTDIQKSDNVCPYCGAGIESLIPVDDASKHITSTVSRIKLALEHEGKILLGRRFIQWVGFKRQIDPDFQYDYWVLVDWLTTNGYPEIFAEDVWQIIDHDELEFNNKNRSDTIMQTAKRRFNKKVAVARGTKKAASFSIGDEVQVSGGSGIDSDKSGVIVETGVDESKFKTDTGEIVTMYNNRLFKIGDEPVRLKSDEDISETYKDFIIEEASMREGSDSSGFISLSFPQSTEKGAYDFTTSFIIYDNGKISFDDWFPEHTYDTLSNFILNILVKERNVENMSQEDIEATVKNSKTSKKTLALTVPEKHQKRIAIDTLKMSDAGAGIMGGMTKDEARKFLARIGYSEDAIKKLEASKKTADLPRNVEEGDTWGDHVTNVSSELILSELGATLNLSDFSDARETLITVLKEEASFVEDDEQDKNANLSEENGMSVDPGENTYNWSYLGPDLQYGIQEGSDSLYYGVIIPHMGGDVRGNYGANLYFELDSNDDKDSAWEEFALKVMEMISGSVITTVTFDDGSSVTFDGENDADIPYYTDDYQIDGADDSLANIFAEEAMLRKKGLDRDGFIDNADMSSEEIPEIDPEKYMHKIREEEGGQLDMFHAPGEPDPHRASKKLAMANEDVKELGYEAGRQAAEAVMDISPAVTDDVDTWIELATDSELSTREHSPFEYMTTDSEGFSDSGNMLEDYEQGVSEGIYSIVYNKQKPMIAKKK